MILTKVMKQNAEALSVLARGVFLRTGLQCPHCRRRLHPKPKWSPERTVIDWYYDCPCCGVVLDGQLRELRSANASR